MASANRTPTRHALVIGIDTYPHIPQLEGCVNDARLMRSILQDNFGFPPENITQLLNEEATREAILREMDALVDRAGVDDVVVIQFAGHGSQMTDREGDEPDGLDETIMPFDTEGWRGDNRDITDDEIHLRLLRLAEKTSYTTLIIDACHSGTITRDGFGAKARAQPADTRPVEELPPSPIPAELRRSLRSRGPSGWMPMDHHYVLLAGCRDEETSFEYMPPGESDPVVHGAMTYFLSQELIRVTPGTTYRDVFERVAAKVNANNQRQHPQMEGRVDREIFGVRDVRPMEFVRVASREGGYATLAGGQAHGVTVGSTYAVYPQGTKKAEETEELGRLRITSVGAFESEAEVLAEASEGGIAPATRAVEVEHAYGGFRLGVELADHSGDATAFDGIRDLLGSSNSLDVVQGPAASLRLYALAPRTAVGADDPVPQLGAITEPTLAVVDTGGGLVMPSKRLDQGDEVRSNLEKLARYRNLLQLDNPDASNPLRGRFTLELLRRDAAGQWVAAEPEDAGGQVVYEEGDAIALRIKSRHNAPVFIKVFDFGLSGSVNQVFPRRGASQQLSAGLDFWIWTDGRPVTLKIPAAVPPDYTEGVEAIKVILSEEDVDLSSVEQEGMRGGGAGGRRGSIAQLLKAAGDGSATRDISEPVVADWTSVTRAFLVRRRNRTPLASDAPALNLGLVSLETSGVDAQVTTAAGQSGRIEAAVPTPAALSQALNAADMQTSDTVLLDQAHSAGGRGSDVALTLPGPPPGHGQVVLATDELGILSWHLPEPTPAGAAGRDGAVTYRIPCDDEGRGLAAKMAVAALKVLVFPKIDPLAAKAGQALAEWGEARLRPYGIRSFELDDYTGPQGRPVEGEAWTNLSGGRALLFIHGTTSQAHSAFGQLPTNVMEALHRRYGGRVFAFDHPSLSADPLENVQWLVERMPEGTALDLDILCHSRGGLVARVLSEAQHELSLGNRRIDVGRIVFVGSPNGGTRLAMGSEVGRFLDTYTNLMCSLPGPLGVDALSVILATLKHIAASGMAGLPGLQAMAPDGPFEKRLAAGRQKRAAQYYGLASAYTPKTPALGRFATSQLKGLFDGPHDLVVPADSVWGENGSPYFPLQERVIYTGDEAMSHVEYFGAPHVQTRILEWLEG